MAPPSTAAQSRTRPWIMAAAAARPIPATQGTQGSAGMCGGAWSRPGLCPGIWKPRSYSEGEGECREAGGSPQGSDYIRPQGKRLGGLILLPNLPLPQRVPSLATITDTPTLGIASLRVTPTLPSTRPTTTSPSPSR